MEHPVNWILIGIGAVLVLLEVLLGALSGFDLLLLGTAILIGGLAGVATGTPVIGLAAAALLSLLYLTVGRRRIHRRRDSAHIPFRRR